MGSTPMPPGKRCERKRISFSDSASAPSVSLKAALRRPRSKALSASSHSRFMLQRLAISSGRLATSAGFSGLWELRTSSPQSVLKVLRTSEADVPLSKASNAAIWNERILSATTNTSPGFPAQFAPLALQCSSAMARISFLPAVMVSRVLLLRV